MQRNGKLQKQCRTYSLSVLLLLVLVVNPIVIGVATEFQVDTSERRSTQQGILESLWNSFKHTMEMTTSALTTKASSTTATSRETQSANSVKKLSNWRIQFVKQTLQEHYTQMLVQSSPHLDEGVLSVKPPRKTFTSATTKRATSTQTSQQPVRWQQTIKSGVSCYYFAESIETYWFFQWCPKAHVLQGHQEHQDAKPIVNVLGSFHSSLDMAMHPDIDEFVQTIQDKYSGAMLEVHSHGDLCTTDESADRPQRLSVVVLHPAGSSHCSRAWTDTFQGMAIEKVEEPQVCRYVLHVCQSTSVLSEEEMTQLNDVEAVPPSSTVSEEASSESYESDSMEYPYADIDESAAVALNETMQNIHRSINAYLQQTSADAEQKLNPDRTTALHLGLPPLPKSRVQSNMDLIKRMFTHAYDSYMYNAFPASEIKPMTCEPASFNLVKIPGLTLIDSLDTLVVLGNYTEFARSVERLRGLHKEMKGPDGALGGGGLFAINQNVSVFETNIRVLGGLLSAHQMAEAFLEGKVMNEDVWFDEDTVLTGRQEDQSALECNLEETSYDASGNLGECLSVNMECEATWEETLDETKSSKRNNNTAVPWAYDGFLLELAKDIGDRLLPSFDTKTGIPYGTVNLLHGIPTGETTIASLAGAGTLSLEMELLSRLTGNSVYGNAAKLATRAIWMRRSKLNLLGKHICTESGTWTEALSGIGSNSDSFYEYLIKHHTLFPEDEDFWLQFVPSYGGVYNESRVGEWYGDVDFTRGQSNGGSARKVFEALMAFYPGMQVLLGELVPAARSLNSFFLVREHLGFLPERFNFAHFRVDFGGGNHFLRPELHESAYFLHRSVKGLHQQSHKGGPTSNDSSGWQWAADFALHDLEKVTKTKCGYASLTDISPESTGPAASARKSRWHRPRLMNEMPSFFLSETLKYLFLTFDEHNVLHTDADRDWVFTTEAHPIHHVATPKSRNRGSSLETMARRLMSKLRARLDNSTEASPRETHGYLVTSKWTDLTSLRVFSHQSSKEQDHVDEMNNLAVANAKEAFHDTWPWANSHFLEPLLSTEQVPIEVDFFRETQFEQNLAHMTFKKLGRKDRLTNSCPNIYHPDLKWVHAINGGSLDYSEAYVSSAMDRSRPGDNDFLLLGSLDALALSGSGVHVRERTDPLKKCPIKTQKEKKTEAQSPSTPEQGVDRFNMGGDLGEFEVSAFPGGSGFFIRHVNSGETIVTTLIEDYGEDLEKNAYFMVHGTLPEDIDDDDDDGDEFTLKETLNLDEEESYDEPTLAPERSVVMSDLLGNSFRCRIELVEAFGTSDGEEVDQFASEQLLSAYPCAPAMFGPAHVAELVKSEGVLVDSLIRVPSSEDDYSCQQQESRLSSSNQDSVQFASEAEPAALSTGPISLVPRGMCTFQEKALNQRVLNNAAAVIIINSEEEELFVMSGGVIEGRGPLDSSNIPPSVLVTGADGKEIVRQALEFDSSDENSELRLRVSIVRESATIVQSDKAYIVSNNEYWPVVQATTEALQVFAKGGWGVHAVQNSKSDENTEWQLFLMQHGVQQPNPGNDQNTAA